MPDPKKLFEFIRANFNRKVDTEPDFRALVANFNKTIFFSLEDGGRYCFSLVNGYVPEIKEGTPLRFDIKIMTNTENLLALLSGKLDPMQAMMTRKLRVSASLQDVAWLKRFLNLNKSTISNIIKDYETS